LRFVPVPRDPFAPHPASDYLAWGGNFADVILTFPELRDPLAVAQWVDRYAYVPKPGIHTAFINKSLLGDVSRSEAAAKRVVPGNELTSTVTEKDFGRVMDFLIRSGVDANAGDVDGVTAIMLACKFGLLFIVRKLLLRGADPNLTDAMGNTAMHYAHAFKQSAAVDILTEFTSDGESGSSVLDNVPNAEGRSPRDVYGMGIGVFPDSAERLVNVPRVAPKSNSLHITQAF
jgi:ankyrin repeat protein